MQIELAPDAPLLLKALTQGLLFAHIGGASLGLVSGTVAIAAKKGGTVHKVSGKVFVGAMIAMGAAGAVTAPFMPSPAFGSAFMGAFVCYLAATAWMALRRRPGESGRFEARAMVFGGAVGLGFLLFGIGEATAPAMLPGNEPATLGFVAAALAAIAVGSDGAVLRAGGLAGPARIRRHVWRISLALAITWGSFAGQPEAQPAFLKGSPLLALPALTVLGLMVYWLTRYRTRRPAGRPAVA